MLSKSDNVLGGREYPGGGDDDDLRRLTNDVLGGLQGIQYPKGSDDNDLV